MVQVVGQPDGPEREDRVALPAGGCSDDIGAVRFGRQIPDQRLGEEGRIAVNFLNSAKDWKLATQP